MKTQVIVHHLEMLNPEGLRSAPAGRIGMAVSEACLVSPELARFLYTAVGGDWTWTDRLAWSAAQWSERLSRLEVRTWIASVDGATAGYFELEAQANGSVEIVYFGLLPQFVGQGLGGDLLTRAVREAWGLGARRVWVHTCSLDHPGALANYLARGFKKFHEELTEADAPAHSPGPRSPDAR